MDILTIGKGWFPEEPGGLNRYVYDTTYALTNVGVNVKGMVAGSEQVKTSSGGKMQAFSASNASLMTRWLGARKLMADYIGNNSISLVVSHFSLYTFPTLNQLGHRPLVVHFHGPWALESRAEGAKGPTLLLKKWLEQTCYRQASAFIVLSQAFQGILHREYDIPLAKIKVVPGGVDMDHFQLRLSRQGAREKLVWPTDRPIVVTVRRLAKRMGLESLLQAMAQLQHHHPNLLLKIAGKGALKDALQQQIDDLGLSQQVELMGYVPDEQLPLIYRAADICVVPTVSLEGFGLTVVESLAAGTPVLGTPVGGIPEILRPFSKDLVLEGSSPAQLAQGIDEALAGVRYLPSSAACQDYIRRGYSWPAIAQQLKSIYVAAAEGKVL